MTEKIIWQKLKEPFPKEKVSWRAQTVSRDGKSCLALAYIDARDVYDRLDDVVGQDGWQCEYIQEKDRTYCRIGIYSDERGQWIWKSNAAGDTAVEKEKGAASDALKRAAVAWGIGRYLYDFENVWVPCQATQYQGKWKWRKFTADPWQGVKNPSDFLPDDDSQPLPQQGDKQKPSEEPQNANVLESVGACDDVADIAKSLNLQGSMPFVMSMQHLSNTAAQDDCSRDNLVKAYNRNLEAIKSCGKRAFDAYKQYSKHLAENLKNEVATD